MPSLQADHAASRSLRQARGQRPAGTRGEMTEPSQGLGAGLGVARPIRRDAQADH
jgi:hypothetical protein